MKVKVTLNCKVKSGHIDVLIPFLEKNLPHVRGFNGCLGVSVYFDKINLEMLLEESWLSVEHHQAYMKHIESNGILGQLAALLESAPIIKYFQKEYI